jgi:Flp pilus assembly protein TadG
MVSVSKSAQLLRRFGKDKRGNVLMIMGFALIPITMAAGMTVDYTRAARLKTKLDAAADAAVLSAVSEAARTATDKTVCERAAALFDSQAGAVTNIGYSKAASLTLTVGSKAAPNNVYYNSATNQCSAPVGAASSAEARVVSLSYSVQSNNFFGGLFNMMTLPVSGRTGSEVSIAPDTDFYIALDTSPSMALPVTTAGINDLVSSTAMYNVSGVETKKGCAFACHSNKIEKYISGSLGETPQDDAKWAIVKEAVPRVGLFGTEAVTYIDGNNAFVYNSLTRKVCYDDWPKYGSTSSTGCTKYRVDKNVYYADGTLVDTYWYTRNKGIALRIDEMRRATSDLVGTALTEAAKNEATYRAAIYGFDAQDHFRKIYPLLNSTPKLETIAEKNPSAATIASGNAFKAKAMSTDIDIALIDDKTDNGRPLGSTSDHNYRFTSFKGLFDGMLAGATNFLPTTSGKGTRIGGDTPQAFLFIITDGMSDEKASLVGGLYSQGTDRTRSEITGPGNNSHLSKCDAIKARGVQIGILYTKYTKESIASDEAGQRTWVEGRIPYVKTALENCATPGYMVTVESDGDISAALKALFQKAVAKPRLVK